MHELFKVKDKTYNLRNVNTLATHWLWPQCISYLAPKIWDIVPTEIKNSATLNYFKKKIKTWIPTNCPCTLCKEYISNLGYI